jgi:CrcB protein
VTAAEDSGRRPPVGAEVLVIAAGGGAGSVLRYVLSRAIVAKPGGFPVATLVTNLSGALLLGVLIAAVTARPVHPLLRPALGTGLLGGYTTFSTFALEVRGMATGTAAGYLAASLAGGLALAAAGESTTRRLLRATPYHPVSIDPDLP